MSPGKIETLVGTFEQNRLRLRQVVGMVFRKGSSARNGYSMLPAEELAHASRLFWNYFSVSIMTLPSPMDVDELVGRYLQQNERWDHTGENHANLGMAYAQWAIEQNITKENPLTNYTPDISFTSAQIGCHVWGDIHQTSYLPTFFMDIMHRLEKHDLWVTVVNEETQIILECDVPLNPQKTANAGYKIVPYDPAEGSPGPI